MAEGVARRIQQTENLVVGTGFVALQALESLQAAGIDALCIDVSRAIQPNKVVSGYPEYDPEALLRTAVPGGGAWFWGGKVTLPSNENWFRPHAHISNGWKDFGNWAVKSESSRDRGIFERALRGKPRYRALKRKASKLSLESFINDTHVHLHGKRSFNRKVQNLGRNSIEAAYGLQFRGTSSGWVVGFESVGGEQIEILAKRIFLASGTIGNMFLLEKITGKTKFSLGNHAGATPGKIVFSSRLPLRDFGALAPWGQFQSWSKASESGLNHSFRIAPASTLTREVQKASQYLRELKLIPAAKLFFELIATYALLRPKHASIYAMLDTGLHAQAEILSKGDELDFDTTELRVTVNSREYLDTGEADFEHFLSMIVASGIGLAEELQAFEGGDTHHYFGTCPMREPVDNFLTVDENFEVRGYEGLFSLGSASFPVGSHGHPTLLAVLTAKYAVEKIFGSNSAPSS